MSKTDELFAKYRDVKSGPYHIVCAISSSNFKLAIAEVVREIMIAPIPLEVGLDANRQRQERVAEEYGVDLSGIIPPKGEIK
mgnify:CR=1 FL=1